MSSFNMSRVLYGKSKTYAKISIVAVFVILIAFVVGFVYKNQFASAASEQTCGVYGVTVKWTADDDTGMVCDEASGAIINNVASEITLTGEATDYVVFINNSSNFTTLNLDNLTKSTPINDITTGLGISIDSVHSSESTINIFGDNVASYIEFFGGILNINGPGTLNTAYVGDARSGEGILNLDTNITITPMTNLPYPFSMLISYNLNILGGNVTVTGESNDQFLSLIAGEHIYIANGTNVSISVNNVSLFNGVYGILPNASFTLGDKVLVTRDGNSINDMDDISNYLVEPLETAHITFNSLTPPQPSIPTPTPDGDLTPPNTGLSR